MGRTRSYEMAGKMFLGNVHTSENYVVITFKLLLFVYSTFNVGTQRSLVDSTYKGRSVQQLFYPRVNP